MMLGVRVTMTRLRAGDSHRRLVPYACRRLDGLNQAHTRGEPHRRFIS
jgi:hypothetical protein